MSDMRHLIQIIERHDLTIVESGKQRARPMSRSYKPFSQVTKEDVARAFFDIDDIRNFMENQWDQIEWGEDEHGEPLYPDLPHSSAALSAEQVAKVIAWYGGEERITDKWAEVWEDLTPISIMPVIPVTRRLNRLSDLGQPFGIHWSYGTTPWPGMDSYGSHVAFGLVDNQAVDWVCTAARAINSWDSEGEISMLPGAKLALQKIEFGPGAMIIA